jgi:iron(III) transport system substrate-binding protein
MKGLFRATNGWKAVGYRSRRIVINTNLLVLEQAPRRLMELTNSVWRGKVALAYPLFGTTATHFMALRPEWGEERWENWCRGLVENKSFLVDGNSVVVQLVGRGEAWIGLTDSDDVAAGQREGFPITALPMTPDTLLIPNTVAFIGNAPHPNEAQQLFDYLQSHEVVEQLVRANALEGTHRPDSDQPILVPNWPGMLQELESTTKKLQEIFLR